MSSLFSRIIRHNEKTELVYMPVYHPFPKYKIATLCGSTKFKKEYIEASEMLTSNGYIVLSCPLFHHADGLEFSVGKTNMLDDMHKQRIDMSSEVFVINKNRYIGESTNKEIEYALKNGKKVIYLW